MMDNLKAEFLEAANGDVQLAAVNFAYGLTVGDPATFKMGYTPRNAALAANELFGVDVNLIQQSVEIRQANAQ